MAPTNRRCAVLNCKRPHKEGSLFRPPHPNKYWDLFLLWVKATGNPKYAQMDAKECHKKMLICEVHFSSEELIELRNRVKRCIPSKNLPDPIEVQLGIDTDAAPAVTFCAIEKENILTPKRQATAIL
ncbi:uncharacterized protein LOC108912433 [Anoplophora glabripennis]|uniref:uncharacterized protein LOC108912433 n=1 Tax=Anoplophora glabripennis TaxID=217634 RepID=UPI0008755B4C|nr:uncharacterized protein LOC108912433 [Anoplophora glabripennis]